MKNYKVRVGVVTAVLAIILMGLSIFIQRKAVNIKPQIQVYKATKTLKIGDKINSSNCEPTNIDMTSDSLNYVKSLNDTSNMIVKEPIYKGEDINKNRLVDKSDNSVYIADSTTRKFSIPVSYIDDPFSLTFRKGDKVDILFTQIDNGAESKIANTKVEMPNAIVVGAIDENGALINDSDKNKLATAILFQSTTGNIINITQDQYKGKFKFAEVPNNN
ncbi:SAF domain-containing protein [Clostridium akagii]|uniref:SAF domain-containing protein n=1 Tax=Clostridium akagii TaxID=91623 RepID=UPI0004798F2C|nr:SAF domain-containing protein [Clostridium akagii]